MGIIKKKAKKVKIPVDIDFHSLTSADKFNASEAALNNLSHIISELQSEPDAAKRLFGNVKNNLLQNCIRLQ